MLSSSLLGEKLPGSSKTELETCSEMMFISFQFMANYPFPPLQDSSLDFKGFVRACAFATGRAVEIYRALTVRMRDLWNVQLPKHSDDIISDVLFRSIAVCNDNIELYAPDERIVGLIAALQPVLNDQSVHAPERISRNLRSDCYVLEFCETRSEFLRLKSLHYWSSSDMYFLVMRNLVI